MSTYVAAEKKWIEIRFGKNRESNFEMVINVALVRESQMRGNSDRLGHF